MKKSTNPINATVQPIAGRQLPSDWQQKATLRAKIADVHYQYMLENKWRLPADAVDPNVARAARLSNPSPGPSVDEMWQRQRLNSKGSPNWEDLLGKQ